MMPASSKRASAWLVLAICIRDIGPSCIRAPPDAVAMSSGRPRSRAASAAFVISSPPAAPRLPPRKRKSMTAAISGLSSMRPAATTTPSRRPVLRRACSSRSKYGLVSANDKMSSVLAGKSKSSTLPGSKSWPMRSIADSRWW